LKNLTVCYLPAQWRSLGTEQLRASTCVVIDVIRATSTIAAALAQGAAGITPVASVAEAEQMKARHPETLLAGERQGRMLPGFDLGNSPRDVTAERVGGRGIILTTTNGTQALAACRGARAVVTTSLLNLGATAAKLRAWGPPWIILCAGFEGDFGLDDAIVAGALAEALGEPDPFVALYRSVRGELASVLLRSSAGQELVKIGLDGDVPYCAELDRFSVVPTLDEAGVLRAG
jgi:2-phosphosulfolactate phosphatase